MRIALVVLGVLLIIIGMILSMMLFGGDVVVGVFGLLGVLFGIVLLRVSKRYAGGKGAGGTKSIPDEIRVPIPDEEYDTEKVVTSMSSGNEYRVNLHRLTCTCPDFKMRRWYVRGDLRRHCKHINRLLSNTEFFADMPEIVRAVIGNGFNIGHGMEFMHLDDDEKGIHQPILLGFQNDKEWLNVFTWKRGTQSVDRHGFNVIQKRWSYGEGPQNAKLIKAHILKSYV